MVLCPVRDSLYYDDNKNPVNEYFECPGPEDPPDHNRCCEDGCCPTVILDSIMNLDIHVAMAISLTVISACVVTGIIIVICCFVSSCPCYDTLSGGWGKGEPDIFLQRVRRSTGAEHGGGELAPVGRRGQDD